MEVLISAGRRNNGTPRSLANFSAAISLAARRPSWLLYPSILIGRQL